MFMVHSIFASVQGEGMNTGRPAIFVRLSGCNLSCVWCDTNHEEGERYSVKRLAKEIIEEADGAWGNAVKEGLIVITGGEPVLQPIDKLIREIQNTQGGRQFGFAVETNGTLPLPIKLLSAFVSVGLKGPTMVNRLTLADADEVKIVIGATTAREEHEAACIRLALETSQQPVWLQPESNFSQAVDRCVDLARNCPSRLRVGHQMHVIRGWE